MSKCRCGTTPYPIYTTLISGSSLPRQRRSRIPSFLHKLLKNGVETKASSQKIKQKIVQTMFRESEAQTDPFEPDVLEPVDKSMEILTLGWLSYNNGLPAGMREVIVIERARQRRAWEKALPLPYDNDAKEIRDMILSAIEINEWAYREVELAALSALRIEMASQCIKKELCDWNIITESKVSRFASWKLVVIDDKIQKSKRKVDRFIRKLYVDQMNGDEKKGRKSLEWQLSNRGSEFYCHEIRMGPNSKMRQEKIDKHFRYWNVFSTNEVLHQKLDYEPEDERFSKLAEPRSRAVEMCSRELKWSGGGLENLVKVMRRIRMWGSDTQRPPKFKRLIPPNTRPYHLPETTPIEDAEENVYQGSLFLQKTIKGRAIQTAMFEGRCKCQELLDELKSTHALVNAENEMKICNQKMIQLIQRNEELRGIKEKRKLEILRSLEGKTVGEVLDFLSKELLRLQEERVIHAIALRADQERHKREGEEAGRRQLEENRKREMDEMYRQICKVFQCSVDEVINTFDDSGSVAYARQEAVKWVDKLAKKVDLAANEANLRQLDIESQEIIADLVHNFALPEAEKVIVRERLRRRQKTVLVSCHEEVYRNIERLVKGPRSPNGKLLKLIRPRTHRTPTLIPVKFYNLIRYRESKESFASYRRSLPSIVNSEPAFVPTSTKNTDDQWSTGFTRHEVVMG